MGKRRIVGEDGRVYVEKKRGGCLKYLGLAILILIGLGVIGSMLNPEDNTPSETLNVAQTSEQVVSEEKTEVVVQNEETTEAVSQSEEKEDDVPREYKNALAKAESYFEVMNMSKQAIYDQLTSEYGEKFPAEAAQYAVDNLQVDYKEAALKKAKSYAETMNMSNDGIYDQLVSEYGEQFTPEEAQYAIDNLD